MKVSKIVQRICQDKGIMYRFDYLDEEVIRSDQPFHLYNNNFFAVSFSDSSLYSRELNKLKNVYDEELNWEQYRTRYDIIRFLCEILCIQTNNKFVNETAKDANRICDLINLASLDSAPTGNLYLPFMFGCDIPDLPTHPTSIPRVQAVMNLLTRGQEMASEELQALDWYCPSSDRSKRYKNEIKKKITKYL